jgi:hypothetical protein
MTYEQGTNDKELQVESDGVDNVVRSTVVSGQKQNLRIQHNQYRDEQGLHTDTIVSGSSSQPVIINVNASSTIHIVNDNRVVNSTSSVDNRKTQTSLGIGDSTLGLLSKVISGLINM